MQNPDGTLKRGKNSNGDKEKLITENLGLVHMAARRFLSDGVEYDELVQSGSVGLILAADRFDESLGYKFSTFAVPYITGEIKKSFRHSGAVYMPRKARETALELHREMQKEGMKIETAACKLGIGVSEAGELLCVFESALPLDETEKEDNGFEDKVISALCMKQALKILNEDEKKVFMLRKYRGLSQQYTADILNMSQSKISRIERSALKKLASVLG